MYYKCLGNNVNRTLEDRGNLITLSYELINYLMDINLKQTQFSCKPGILVNNEESMKHELQYSMMGEDNVHIVENIVPVVRKFLSFTFPIQIEKVFEEEKALMNRTLSLEEFSSGRDYRLSIAMAHKTYLKYLPK